MLRSLKVHRRTVWQEGVTKLQDRETVGLVASMARRPKWTLFWALLLGAAANVVQAATSRKLLSTEDSSGGNGCHCEKVRRGPSVLINGTDWWTSANILEQERDTRWRLYHM